MSTNKKLISAVAAYLLVSIVTYGNAIDHFRKQGDAEVMECKTYARTPDACEFRRASGVAGAISAIVWPLYWSYRLQRSAA